MVSVKKKFFKRFFIGTFMIFVLLAVFSFALAKSVYDSRYPRFDYVYPPDNSESCEMLSFESDGNTLMGYLYNRGGENGLVVVAPGLASGANEYSSQIEYLTESGLAVFAYDPTGSYYSEGESSVGFLQSIIDLNSALDYIEEKNNFGSSDIFLFGHSCGGYAVCAALSYDHDISAAVSVAGVNSAMEAVTSPVKARIGALAYSGYIQLYIYQSALFGTELVNLSAVESINGSDTAVMIVHGTDDETIPFDYGSIISHCDEIDNPLVEYKVCGEDGMDGHTNLLFDGMTTREINEELMRQISEFFREHRG